MRRPRLGHMPTRRTGSILVRAQLKQTQSCSQAMCSLLRHSVTCCLMQEHARHGDWRSKHCPLGAESKSGIVIGRLCGAGGSLGAGPETKHISTHVKVG